MIIGIGMIETYIKEKDKVCVLELWKLALDNEFSKTYTQRK